MQDALGILEEERESSSEISENPRFHSEHH